MQKEIIVVSIILIIMTVFSITVGKYTNETIKLMHDDLEQLLELVDKNSDNIETIKKLAEEIYYKWRDTNKILSLFLEHNELEKITTSVTTMKKYLEVGDNKEAVVEIEKCKYILDHLKEKSTFSFMNLF